MANPTDIVDTTEGGRLTSSESTTLDGITTGKVPKKTATGFEDSDPYNPAAAAITGGTATGLTQLATTAASSTLLGGAAASATSSLAVLSSKTLAAPAAGSLWDGVANQASTLTVTMGAGAVTITALKAVNLYGPTILTGTGAGALTVTDAYNVYIGAAPVAGSGTGTTTLTNAWSLGVEGAVKITGALRLTNNDGGTGMKFGCIYNVNSNKQFGIGDADTPTSYFRIVCAGPQLLMDAIFNGVESVLTLGNTASGIAFAGSISSTDLYTRASATSAVLNKCVFANSVAVTGATAITTATGFNLVSFSAPTITGNTATCAISLAATVYISGAPIASTNVTIAKPYSLWIDAGLPRIDSTTANGSVAVVLGAIGPAGANTTVQEWLTIDINGTTRYLPCF